MLFKKKLNTNEIIDRIKSEEGFRGFSYKDTLNKDTIGFGTLLPLTRDEAEMILVSRFNAMKDELYTNKEEINKYPLKVQEILLEMCYQLGVPNLLKFKKMFSALDEKDYETAAKEMLDSRWAKQTPNRAFRLSDRMKEIV